jgi:hypothetical protein
MSAAPQRSAQQPYHLLIALSSAASSLKLELNSCLKTPSFAKQRYIPTAPCISDCGHVNAHSSYINLNAINRQISGLHKRRVNELSFDQSLALDDRNTSHEASKTPAFVLAIGFTPVPRLAGVTSPRQRWFGASTPW